MTGRPVLEIRDLVAGYGHIMALKGVALKVEQGEIVALIGNNGAGKTTTLRTISGLIHPRRGGVMFEGRRIDRLPTHRIVHLGICHVPEGRQIFSRLSVLENLELGAFSRGGGDGIGEDLERVFRLFPRLKERARQAGGTLSGGEQQMLAIARALMARPRLMLLDEPSMGLAPVLVEAIFETVREINADGTTILLVEQNAAIALEVASRGYVLESGNVIMSAPAAELRGNAQVRRAYLGETA